MNDANILLKILLMYMTYNLYKLLLISIYILTKMFVIPILIE
jgi:hypothetical protein